jgi:hypothetical protein
MGTVCLLLVSATGGAASAQGYAKGVNPADNLTRADAALSWVMHNHDSTTTLSFGYEHRLHENWGIGLALTPLAHSDDEGVGTGDFGARIRFIEAEGEWQLGASLAAFGSTGSASALGVARNRVVPAVLVVRPWSSEDFTAFQARWVEWLSRTDDFLGLRLSQGHLDPSGWFLVGTGFYDTDLSSGHDDFGLAVEIGRQIDERWQVAIAPGYSLRGSGDPSLYLRAAYFF